MRVHPGPNSFLRRPPIPTLVRSIQWIAGRRGDDVRIVLGFPAYTGRSSNEALHDPVVGERVRSPPAPRDTEGPVREGPHRFGGEGTQAAAVSLDQSAWTGPGPRRR